MLSQRNPNIISSPDCKADNAKYPIIPSIANEKIREITFFLLKKDEATTITSPMHAAIHMGIKGAKIIEVKYNIICKEV